MRKWGAGFISSLFLYSSLFIIVLVLISFLLGNNSTYGIYLILFSSSPLSTDRKVIILYSHNACNLKRLISPSLSLYIRGDTYITTCRELGTRQPDMSLTLIRAMHVPFPGTYSGVPWMGRVCVDGLFSIYSRMLFSFFQKLYESS